MWLQLLQTEEITIIEHWAWSYLQACCSCHCLLACLVWGLGVVFYSAYWEKETEKQILKKRLQSNLFWSRDRAAKNSTDGFINFWESSKTKFMLQISASFPKYLFFPKEEVPREKNKMIQFSHCFPQKSISKVTLFIWPTVSQTAINTRRISIYCEWTGCLRMWRQGRGACVHKKVIKLTEASVTVWRVSHSTCTLQWKAELLVLYRIVTHGGKRWEGWFARRGTYQKQKTPYTFSNLSVKSMTTQVKICSFEWK